MEIMKGMTPPLKGITVLEFAQYLSGPCAGLRLADLGARVIKIEQPLKGETGRRLAIKNMWVDESSLLFHTINRNKESFAADLNDPEDMRCLRALIGQAQVLLHNFRPGVMERKGLGYREVAAINPSIVYTHITGYGTQGKWARKPGQDLLIQAMSGLAHTTGSASQNPTPLGLGIGDYLCGNQAVQFILGALIRSGKTGKGALLELSLLESLIDFQFEFLTTYFNGGGLPSRSSVDNAHALLSAPYGIYKTADGYIAVAMMPLQQLNMALQCSALDVFDQADAFVRRDEIKSVIAAHISTKDTAYWLDRAAPLDLWIAPVLNWLQMKEKNGYKILDMEQEVKLNSGRTFITTRCPIRIDRRKLYCNRPAPSPGQDTKTIKNSLL